MNYRGFKKVREDEHKAVLKNQRGHEITLAKKQLSKSHLDGLNKLPLYASEGADIMSPQEDPVAEAPVATAPVAMPAQPESPMVATNEPAAQAAPAMPLDPEQEKQNHAVVHTAEANKETGLFAQDIQAGHIKPETYKSLYAKEDTLGKIGTLFGLLVSGAGSGLAHQPNAVLEMMNKEIERDFEAQKQNQENDKSYVKLNMENQLNKANIKKAGAETKGLLMDAQLKADTHSKNQMLIAALKDLQDSVNKLPEGPQRAQFQQTLNGVGQAGAAQIMHNNQKLGEALASNPEGEFQKKQKNLRMMGMLGMEGANQMASANEEHHVPGFGQSSVPIPGDVRQELIAKKEYDQAARKYIEFAKKHQANWANLNPVERAKIAKEGAVLGAELQGKYRLKTKGGVYKEGEQEFIQKIIPDNAASWSASFNQIPKVEQTIKNNKMDTDNLAKGYGLPGLPESKEPQKEGHEEGKTGTFKGKPVIFKNGKWEYK